MTRFTQNISEIFTLDLRSLALTRIFVAITLIADLFSRLPSLTTFIGDSGVFPSSLLHATWTREWAWSLHLFHGGDAWLLYALFTIQIFFALALFLGYKTRIATIATWFLLVSLHNANPFMLQGGDFWLRAILFTGMFLPWGSVFSLDARRTKPQTVTLLSGWSVAYLLQIGLFYFFASLYKTGIEWTEEGSAIYYALSIDQYATLFAHFLLQFPAFLTYLTFGILVVQHIALFLMFIPFRNAFFRSLSVALIVVWHLALAACLHLGMFSWISIAASLALIPPAAWDTLQKKFAASTSAVGRFVSHIPTSSARPAAQYAIVSLVGVVYLFYIAAWQTVEFSRLMNTVPETLQIPAKVLRIDQRWNLFAPYPFKNDGWYVMEGRYSDGTSLNLFNDLPLTLEKPDAVFYHYPNMRWRKYTYELRRSGNEWMFPFLGDYLCRAHALSASGAPLESVKVTYVTEQTPPPGTAAQPLQPSIVLEHTCVRGSTNGVSIAP